MVQFVICLYVLFVSVLQMVSVYFATILYFSNPYGQNNSWSRRNRGRGNSKGGRYHGDYQSMSPLFINCVCFSVKLSISLMYVDQINNCIYHQL